MRARMTLALSAGVVLIAACGPLDGELTEEAANRQGFDNFQTAVASERNYDIYWLGDEFEAGGLTFRGPVVAEFGNEIEAGGLVVEYAAAVGAVCCVDLQIRLYGDRAWAIEEERRAVIPKSNLESRNVVVAGTPGVLTTHSGSSLPVNAQRLVLQIGRTHIEASASAAHPLTPTDPQPNPLIDEAAFLAVMEHLRPYPE